MSDCGFTGTDSHWPFMSVCRGPSRESRVPRRIKQGNPMAMKPRSSVGEDMYLAEGLTG